MDTSKRTVGIFTLGCKVNQYESEAIAEALEKRGFAVLPHDTECDAYIINTCTVTAESDRKARQFIRRAINSNPSAFILVTGCLAQTDPSGIAAIAGVDFICGNTNKLLLVDALEELFGQGEKNAVTKTAVESISSAGFEKMEISSFDRTRAYIKIEDGCESRCTYCIIPKARGRIRSKAPSDVLSEVSAFVRRGCREVVLTGIETASYGKDLDGYSLADLLCDVNAIEGDFTVRLGSLDPSCMNESFVERIKDLKKLAPHFHISMQSGCDKTLRNMKRRYNSSQALANIERLRHSIPSVRFTTDMIVGFPNETEEDFEQTIEFAKRADFLMIHVFPFSPRNGTEAADMSGQIPQNVKKARSARLIEAAKSIRNAEFDRLLAEGKTVCDVLFESYEDGKAYGHTRDFLEVCAESPVPLHGEIRTVSLLSHNGETFFAEILDNRSEI